MPVPVKSADWAVYSRLSRLSMLGVSRGCMNNCILNRADVLAYSANMVGILLQDLPTGSALSSFKVKTIISHDLLFHQSGRRQLQDRRGEITHGGGLDSGDTPRLVARPKTMSGPI